MSSTQDHLRREAIFHLDSVWSLTLLQLESLSWQPPHRDLSCRRWAGHSTLYWSLARKVHLWSWKIHWTGWPTFSQSNRTASVSLEQASGDREVNNFLRPHHHAHVDELQNWEWPGDEAKWVLWPDFSLDLSNWCLPNYGRDVVSFTAASAVGPVCYGWPRCTR